MGTPIQFVITFNILSSAVMDEDVLNGALYLSTPIYL